MSRLTRADYELLSSAIRDARDVAQFPIGVTQPDLRRLEGVIITARTIALAISKANPTGFDRQRFLQDCRCAP